jgi:hypothetical protein
MTLKERIIKILEEKNIKHFSREGEIELYPPVSKEIFDFIKLLNNNNDFLILGGLSPIDFRTKEEVKADGETGMHLYIRFNQNK